MVLVRLLILLLVLLLILIILLPGSGEVNWQAANACHQKKPEERLHRPAHIAPFPMRNLILY